MAKMVAGVAVGLLVVVISFSAPSMAFALRLGPFHVGLPFFGTRWRTGIKLELTRMITPELPLTTIPKIRTPAVRPRNLQSDQRLPSSIPASPCRPFMTRSFGLRLRGPLGDDEILQAAFGKVAGDRERRLCQADRGSMVVRHIAGVIRPGAAQRVLLQKLGGALAMASGFLEKFCPNNIPTQAAARLQLAETQLEALITALDIVGGPLQDQQSLDRDQRARLAAALAAPSAGTAPACEAMSTTAEARSISSINPCNRIATFSAPQWPLPSKPSPRPRMMPRWPVSGVITGNSIGAVKGDAGASGCRVARRARHAGRLGVS